MKITPVNVVKFWKRLMFPPRWDDFHSDRISLKGDLPWEPWLHPAVWFATVAVLIVGDGMVVPPVDGRDWLWVVFGLASPVLGFTAVWMLNYGNGKRRYLAVWLRMVSDIGLVFAVLLYYIEMIYLSCATSACAITGAIFPSVVVFFAMWYLLVLVWRDIQLIAHIERIASMLEVSEFLRFGTVPSELDRLRIINEIVFHDRK